MSRPTISVNPEPPCYGVTFSVNQGQINAMSHLNNLLQRYFKKWFSVVQLCPHVSWYQICISLVLFVVLKEKGKAAVSFERILQLLSDLVFSMKDCDIGFC